MTTVRSAGEVGASFCSALLSHLSHPSVAALLERCSESTGASTGEVDSVGEGDEACQTTAAWLLLTWQTLELSSHLAGEGGLSVLADVCAQPTLLFAALNCMSSARAHPLFAMAVRHAANPCSNVKN